MCVYFSLHDVAATYLAISPWGKAPHLIQLYLLTSVHLFIYVTATSVYPGTYNMLYSFIYHAHKLQQHYTYNMLAKYKVVLLNTLSNLQCLTSAIMKIKSNGNQL